MHLLFSYGTLQQVSTQQALFGRTLTGEPDILNNYKLGKLFAANANELTENSQNFYWRAEISDNKDDQINGILYEVTQKELQEMDLYEGSEYKRIKTTFASGKKGWVYTSLN